MKAFDTADWTINKAHAIFGTGYGAVGLYLRSDRSPPLEIEGLRSVGIKLWSIWEKGCPTCASYFDAVQGRVDAVAAVTYAKIIKQPEGSQIFFSLDFDASSDDLKGVCRDYFEAVHDTVKGGGYLASVYGSGQTCNAFVGAGIAHTGWLAQSTGWEGFEMWKPHASILQLPSATVLGLDVDLDDIIDETVLW